MPTYPRTNRWLHATTYALLVATCALYTTDRPGLAAERVASPKDYAKALYMQQGGTVQQWRCLDQLWTMESNWRVNAVGNKTTQGRAYGIPQALPASKMDQFGTDWRKNYQTQIRWGLLYIKLHWKNNSCMALRHEKRKGWY